MNEEHFEEKDTVNNQDEVLEQNEQTVEETDNLILQQQAKIIDLEKELNNVKDHHLRKAAEMENMRKRLQRERELTFQTAREAAVQEFLPVSDDLVRTLQAMKDGGAQDAYVEGIQMVADKFEQVLAGYGVSRIDATGVPFDVNLHDALMRQKPADESIESGTVLQVIENGYIMGEKTLRHAKVIVSE